MPFVVILKGYNMNINKLTRVRLESPGSKYKETLLLQTKLIKTTTDDDGQLRARTYKERERAFFRTRREV